MGGDICPGQRERHMGHLYCLHSDRNLHTHLDQIDVSNGLAWSSDGSTVYYIDSTPRHVYAFDWDGSKGTISKSTFLQGLTWSPPFVLLSVLETHLSFEQLEAFASWTFY